MSSVAERPPVREEAAPRWYHRRLGFFGAVLAIYVTARLFSAIVLIIVGIYQADVVWFENETGYLRMTVLWDAFWYRQIVEDGYPAVLPRDPLTGDLWQNPWAFYPMFPMLTRWLMQLTGAGFGAVGSTLSLRVGAGASAIIGIFLRSKTGPRVALAGVAVWATCITSPTLQVAYTESLGVFVIASALLALDRRRWVLTGFIAVISGLTRAMTLPLGLVALIAVIVRWRERDEQPISRREYISMGWSLAGCGLSGWIWPAVVWLGTGEFRGYTETMTAWRAYDDIQPFLPWWYWANRAFGTPALAWVGLAVIWLCVFALALGPWARALGVTLRAWCFAYPLYLWAVMDPTTSIYRYAILMFPWTILMLGAGWGKPGEDPLDPATQTGTVTWWKWTIKRPRFNRTTLIWAVSAWVIFGLVSQSWWLWEIWQFTPPADNPP